MAVCLAGHDGSQVVGADPDVGGVGHTTGSVGHGMTEGSVGGSDSTISEGVASIAVASIGSGDNCGRGRSETSENSDLQ